MKAIKYDYLMEILNEKKQYALNNYNKNKNTSSGSYYMGYFDMIGEIVEYFELMELEQEQTK